MSRDPARLFFSIVMIESRMVFPSMWASWRRWKMAVSIPFRRTPVYELSKRNPQPFVAEYIKDSQRQIERLRLSEYNNIVNVSAE